MKKEGSRNIEISREDFFIAQIIIIYFYQALWQTLGIDKEQNR